MSKDARLALAGLLTACFFSLGASWRTENFTVTVHSAPQDVAREMCETAERCRRELAHEWLGRELPRWDEPCPIRITVGPHLGAGGATSFMFSGGRPFGWTMDIQGSRERLLDSVIPHEVTHTIFATHFGRPLPRWADEGACTTVEAEVETDKQKRLLIEFLKTNRGIPFNRMFAMTEYPPDVMPLYSQGYSVARFLIAQGGKPRFVQFVGDGMRWNNWPAAVQKHYGFDDLSDLQVTWNDWVRHGSPDLTAAPQFVASRRDDVQAQLAANVSPVAATSEGQPDSPGVPLAAGFNDNGLVSVPPAGEPQRLTPPAEALAIDAQAGGWYSQQQDLMRSGELETAPAESETFTGSNAVGRYQPGSIGRRLPFRMADVPGAAVGSQPELDWGRRRSQTLPLTRIPRNATPTHVSPAKSATLLR